LIAPGLVVAQAQARSGLSSYGDSYRIIVIAMDGTCRMDTIWAPVVGAKTVLISDRELGTLVTYSLQVTRIVSLLAGIKPVVTIEPEYILGLRPVLIYVLELRGPNLNAGPVLNCDRNVPAIGHSLRLSTGGRRLRAESRAATLVCQIALPEHEKQRVDVAAVRPRRARLPAVAILDVGDVAGSMPGCVITIPVIAFDALDQADASKAGLAS
jgi:hypothetical protein